MPLSGSAQRFAERFLLGGAGSALLPAATAGSGLAETMNAERALRKDTGHASVGRSLRSGRVWLLGTVYLMNASVTYGIFLWLPRMLQDTAGPGVSVSWLTALPFVAALIAMVLIGRHSDRTGERKFHVAACAITAAIGLCLAVAFRSNLYLLVLAASIYGG